MKMTKKDIEMLLHLLDTEIGAQIKSICASSAQPRSSSIIAACARCGFRFDPLLGLGCPRCRIEAVKVAFAPLDSLRTALAIKGIRWHGEEPSYVPEQEDDKKFRIPKGERAQIWELKRMRKLIGKL